MRVMEYVKAFALAATLGLLMGGATYAVTSAEIPAFGIAPEVGAIVIGLAAFVFTLQDRIRHG